MPSGNVRKIKTKEKPYKRDTFGLCSWNNYVYIYGGCGIGFRYLNDFWKINGIILFVIAFIWYDLLLL